MAVKQAGLVKQPGNTGSWITLAVEEGALMLRACNRNGEAAEIVVECQSSEDDVPIKKLNPAFLLDIMPFMDGEELHIKYAEGALGAVTMDSGPETDQKFRYGFMPMRMEGDEGGGLE